MEKNSLKLKKHESFAIREGWLEKGINIIYNNPKCFSKDEGILNFGIGSNMVKALKYWLEACNIAEYKNDARLTDFGKILYKYDKYLDNIFSWWMIHFNLASNKDLACVINEFFNMNYTKIEKYTYFNYLKDKLSKDYNIGADSSLESDILVLFKTYYGKDNSNPEQNMNCPLSKLGLVGYSDKKYIKTSPKISSLNYLVVYYCILQLIKKERSANASYNLEDLLRKDNNPLRLFNISLSTLMIYFDEMKRNNLIVIIKTAGLNTIKIIKELSLEEIFEYYYKK